MQVADERIAELQTRFEQAVCANRSYAMELAASKKREDALKAKLEAEVESEKARGEERIAAEKAKSEELAARLKASQNAVASAEAKASSLAAELADARLETTAERKARRALAEELKVTQEQGKAFAASFAEAQRQSLDLTARLDAANRAMFAVRKENEGLQARLEDAEQKIKELQKPKKTKNPIMSLFGKDSAADLSALEQAARRELSAMKRPRGARPRPFKSSQSGIIDV